LHLWGDDSFEESPPSLNPDATLQASSFPC
jgi:hypothetical protein